MKNRNSDQNDMTQDAFARRSAVSSTDCTGLAPSAVTRESQAEGLRQIYDAPVAKPRMRKKP